MKTFDKFAYEINYKKSQAFLNVQIKEVQLKEDDVFKIIFTNEKTVDFESMLDFLGCMKKNFKFKSDYLFEVIAPVFEKLDVEKYLSYVIKTLLKKPHLNAVFLKSRKKIDFNGNFTLWVQGAELAKNFSLIQNDLEKQMMKFGFQNFKFEIKISNDVDKVILLEKEKQKKAAKSAFANWNDVNSQKVNNGSSPRRLNGFTEVDIDQLDSSKLIKVKVKGEIFKISFFQSKNNLRIFSFAITDRKEAIEAKAFAFTSEKQNWFENFQENDCVEICGNYQIDTYTKKPIISIVQIKKLKPFFSERIDKEEEKRIELNARTQMSMMDGVANVKDIVSRAEKWGHDAIAIVDTESVQSFPDFYNVAKNSHVKPIYGVTLNALSKNLKAIINPMKERVLINDKYIVIDLETTGLSPTYNEIIEYGASVVHNSSIVHNEQFFVKPTKKISAKITKITNITNEQLKNAISEKEAIMKIRDSLSDLTIVAHNASFDIGFINAKLIKYGMPEITNPVIDTLTVGKITLPKVKRFNLQSIAKKYFVYYDPLIAHRADYDAQILAKIWIKMIGDLENLKVKNQMDLFNYQDDNVYSKIFSHEATLLAKNQEGLKEMFQILSIANTKNFYTRASIFYEDFNNFKNILVGSGSLKSMLIQSLFFKTKNDVISEIKKYDYIEVPPPQNFAHYLAERTIEEIHDALRFLIRESKKAGKIVVAIGDVRYLDKEDKIYHEVYINSKGLGGKRHYLYNYDLKNGVYPDQHFLTTKEMKKEFSFLQNNKLVNEVVVQNTHKINQMIEKIVIIKDKLYTPLFKDADEKLTNLVYENAFKKYGKPLPTIIANRISKELAPIKKYGFAVIYWISYLLVHKSLQDGYLVGSRGSVGSSFVAHMAEITEVNPLEPHYFCSKCKHSEFFENSSLNSGFDLPSKKCLKCNIFYEKDGQKIPFETFLGFKANKIPDIDLNFSGEYQSLIHQEVKKIFGDDHCFRAGTISTVAAKTAFGYVKTWVEDHNKNLSNLFVEFLSKKVTGTKRTSGQHPGGIIVIPKSMDVEDFTPINFPANDKNSSWKTTHFDFHAIHDNVLKLDLLGHDDPTAIRYLEKITNINAKNEIKFDDPKIIELFSSTKPLGIDPKDVDGETSGVIGVPEFGTNFVRRMLKKAKVKSFGDLIAVSGLSHGTNVWTNNAESIIKNHGQDLGSVISCRDNIMMDLMAKKLDPLFSFEIMEKVRKGKGLTTDQEKTLLENGVQKWYIESLQKIKYMFPKAHATAYVMMAWRIAWFKIYKPIAYYATYLTTRADFFDIDTISNGKDAILEKLQDFKRKRNSKTEKLLSNKDLALISIFEIVIEAFARGIKILNIDINKSEASDWTIVDEKTLLPPLTALDGLGELVAHSIVDARLKRPFESVEDLERRTSINKTSVNRFRELGILKKFFWNKSAWNRYI